MTSKEQAQEIFEIYYYLLDIKRFETARIQSIICVKYIKRELESQRVFEVLDYWNEVEKEINKL